MSEAYPHLNPATVEMLDWPMEKRIEKIRSPRWIGYPEAQKILAKLEDLLTYPKSHRMPNLLVVGDTNNGKTLLVNRFCDAHPPDDNPQGDGIVVPVLYVQAPPTPDEGRFYNAILDKLFAPFRPSDRVNQKQFQAVKLLRYVGTQILVVDEIHQILAGNLNKQHAFLNVIKYLGNELQIPIVGVGTKDAFRALQTDPQLANRFDPALLPRWRLGKDYLRLLMSFERMLPLKEPSKLYDSALANQIFSMSEGYIGEISAVVTRAAVEALQNGKEKITDSVLKRIDWCPPSKRRYRPETGG